MFLKVGEYSLQEASLVAAFCWNTGVDEASHLLKAHTLIILLINEIHFGMYRDFKTLV